jgi:hyperosmotically inducible periplasmic protein
VKLLAVVFALGAALFAQTSSQPQLATRPAGPSVNENRVAKEVRHELLMLPYYSLFDDLEFQVNGSEVTLLGSVANPVVKTDAEKAVKQIEGVEKVNNQIKVLPPSSMDDQIRARVASQIFSTAGLSKYSWSAVPSIHIIVDRGHVTLKGVVDNEMDKNLADIAANRVPGVFSVSNDLQVAETKSSKK